MKEKLLQLQQGKLAPLIQFIKFGLVGVSNTVISYGVEMMCYYVLFRSVTWDEQFKVILVTALAFIVSVTNSYYWNSRFVFRQNGKRSVANHLKSYCKTVACYALTGLVLSPAVKLWLVSLTAPYWLASIVALVFNIPLNFLMNKFWAFGEKKREKSTENSQ